MFGYVIHLGKRKYVTQLEKETTHRLASLVIMTVLLSHSTSHTLEVDHFFGPLHFSFLSTLE